MAVRIPIVTDFDGKGIARARREFAQLEGVAAKTKYALGKAALPAAAAFTALAGATTLAVKAAIEDQASQEQLARTIRATTTVTEAQIAANSEWIDSLSKATGFVDDDIRPSFAKLVRATKDVTKSQRLMALAADVARGTGQDLNSVTDAFTRALGGNLKSIRKLSPELGQLIKDGASADEIFSALAGTFGGDAAAYANTAAGKFEVFAVRVNELKEAFGNKLIPFLTNTVIPKLEALITWAEENPQAFRDIAAAVGILTGAIILLNIAMALNPAVLLAGAIAAVGAAAVIAYRNSEPFRQWIDDMADKLRTIYDWATKALRPVEKLVNLVPDVITGGDGAPWWRRALGDTLTPKLLPGLPFDVPGIPFMASGGIVTGPTLAVLGDNPGGMEAVVPLSGPNARGLSTAGTVVNVHVNGGDPQAVVDAIVKWSRQNGPLPPQVRVA